MSRIYSWPASILLFSLLGSAQSTSKIPTAVTSNSIPQPINGALQGKVSDETGKSVPGAVITFRHFFTVQGRNQQVTTKNDAHLPSMSCPLVTIPNAFKFRTAIMLTIASGI